jgi:hypothetical protein
MALDFTEIASPSRGASDDFEHFCRDFLETVRHLKVVKDVSRGADGGIDIGVSDLIGGRHLVSCKHFATSNRAVGRYDEQDVLDRMHEHDCNSFIGMYSTIASTGLVEKLERLRKTRGISFEIVDYRRIESELLKTGRGFELIRRYFKNSLTNLAPRFISVLPSYALEDCEQHDTDSWSLETDTGSIRGPDPSELLRIANEGAMSTVHEPMFAKALNEAVRLYPTYFKKSDEARPPRITSSAVVPNYAALNKLRGENGSVQNFVFAIWSMFDDFTVNQMLLDMDAIPLFRIGFAVLAQQQGTEHRDILARLFAYRPV